MNQWATSRPVSIFCPVRRNLVKKLQKNVEIDLNDEDDEPFSDKEALQKIYEDIIRVEHILYIKSDLVAQQYYGQWDLSLRQGSRVMHAIENNNPFIATLLESLRKKTEPLQILNGSQFQDEDEAINEHQTRHSL